MGVHKKSIQRTLNRGLKNTCTRSSKELTQTKNACTQIPLNPCLLISNKISVVHQKSAVEQDEIDWCGVPLLARAAERKPQRKELLAGKGRSFLFFSRELGSRGGIYERRVQARKGSATRRRRLRCK
jgi:hypothetical protein